MNINAIVNDNVVRFVKYKQGQLFYRVRVPGELIDRIFPVDISDVGHATLPATGNAIQFIEFIRKAIGEGTFVRQIIDASVSAPGMQGKQWRGREKKISVGA